MAGTSLKTALVNMAKPTKKMKAVMDEYNISLSNSDGTMKPLSQVTEELRTKMGGLDKATQAAAAAQLFGKESLAGMLAVINASPEDYAKLTASINNADGAAEKMAKTMGNNLQGKIKLIKSSLEGLGIQIYEKMKKPLTDAATAAIGSLADLSKQLQKGDLADAVDKIALGFAAFMKALAEGLVTWIPRLIKAFAWLIDNSSTIASLMAGIGAAIVAMSIGKTVIAIIGIVKAFQAIQAILPGLTLAQWAFDAAIAACGGPVVWIISIIVGLIAALVVLWNTNDNFRNGVINIWNSIVDAVVGAVTTVISFVQSNWKQLLLMLVNPFYGAVALLYKINPKFREWVNNLWTTISTGFMNILNAIKTWGASVIAWVVTNVPLMVNGIINWFAQLPGKVLAFFTNIYTGIMVWGATLWSYLSTIFMSILNTVIAWGASVLTWVVTTFTQIVDSIVSFFDQLPYRIGYAIGFVLGTLISWGIAVFTYLTTNVPIWINTVVNFFATLPARIWAWLVSAFNYIVTWGTSVYTTATTWISNTINGIVNWFAQLPGRIWAWLVDAYTKIVAWGSQTYASMSSAISRAVNVVITWFSQLPGRIWTWLSSAIAKIIVWGNQVYSSMSSAVSKAINAVINWFAQLPGRVWSYLSSTLSRVGQFASNLASKAAQAGANMASSLINAVSRIPGKMASVGGNIVRGIWNGITGMAGWLASKVASFAGGIVQGIKDSLIIKSPSHIMRDEVGAMLPRGIAVGFEDEMPNLQNGIDSNLSDMVAKMKGTVDYETAKTTANVVAQHNYKVDSTLATNEANKANSNQTVIAQLIVDGKEFTQTVTAPNQTVLNDFYKGR